MSAHEIVWSFDQDYVGGKLVCNDPDCEYRYSCADFCEVVYDVERHEGGYRHLADTKVDGEPVWHDMKRNDYCNFVEWVDVADVTESSVRSEKFEIARTPVKPVWLNYDGVQWMRTEPDDPNAMPPAMFDVEEANHG